MDQDWRQRVSHTVACGALPTRGTAGLALLVALAASWILASCSEPTDPGYVWTTTDYVVPIDSMRVTSPVVLGDTLRVWLWGEVGPAPCYEFHSIRAAHWTEWQVSLMAVGSMSTGGPCPGPITYLEGEEYAYAPPAVGLVVLRVEHCSGPEDLVDTVEVIGPEEWRPGARSN